MRILFLNLLWHSLMGWINLKVMIRYLIASLIKLVSFPGLGEVLLKFLVGFFDLSNTNNKNPYYVGLLV